MCKFQSKSKQAGNPRRADISVHVQKQEEIDVPAQQSGRRSSLLLSLLFRRVHTGSVYRGPCGGEVVACNKPLLLLGSDLPS